ncbi:hypothetical protein PMAYCL1PPCAC_08049, partial [Pristionchus mayeri]
FQVLIDNIFEITMIDMLSGVSKTRLIFSWIQLPGSEDIDIKKFLSWVISTNATDIVIKYTKFNWNNETYTWFLKAISNSPYITHLKIYNDLIFQDDSGQWLNKELFPFTAQLPVDFFANFTVLKFNELIIDANLVLGIMKEHIIHQKECNIQLHTTDRIDMLALRSIGDNVEVGRLVE